MMDHTDNADCWWFFGAKSSGGYGQIWDKKQKRQVLAHRYYYETFIGPIPDGMYVCHHCDNKRCVNPEHLFLGSPLTNSRDAANKDRFAHTRPPNSGRKRRPPQKARQIVQDKDKGYRKIQLREQPLDAAVVSAFIRGSTKEVKEK